MRNVTGRLLVFSWLCAAVIACNAIPGTSSTNPPAPSASVPPTAAMPSSPSSSVPTTPAPVDHVTSPAQAAAVVFAFNPLFNSVSQPIAGVIGASTSYQAAQVGDGFSVSVTIGSGDCPAGCINQHTWNYSVSGAGTVTLVSEQGDPAEVSIDHGTAGLATISVRLVAGPVCPVERNPPDPSCAPRPVAGTTVVLRDPSGAEVARGTSSDLGSITFSAPGGAYYVESAGAADYLRGATAQAFSVPDGRSVSILMEYDTGIR